MFDGLERALGCGMILLLCSVPLAIWKLVEIVIWLCQHVRIG
jgi:hypothetical protein